MGRIIRFRRRRLKSLDEFDRRQRLRFWPEDRVTAKGVARDTWRWLGVLRPFILLGILVSAWVATDPALIEPPAFLSTGSETVDERFTRCGPGRGHACVIDGDTFKLGDRKVRIIGIDAPETHSPGCAAEARLGEAATAKLQALLNEGAFTMTAPVYGGRDRYGRDLRSLTRTRPDGSSQSIAAEMRDAGLAHRYLGGFKSGWC